MAEPCRRCPREVRCSIAFFVAEIRSGRKSKAVTIIFVGQLRCRDGSRAQRAQIRHSHFSIALVLRGRVGPSPFHGQYPCHLFYRLYGWIDAGNYPFARVVTSQNGTMLAQNLSHIGTEDMRALNVVRKNLRTAIVCIPTETRGTRMRSNVPMPAKNNL